LRGNTAQVIMSLMTTTETAKMVQCLAEMFGMRVSECSASIASHANGSDLETAIRAAYAEEFEDAAPSDVLKSFGH
jgi:hypothetical protein